ncbi:MAG: transcription antitermination factor NusB [Alphaproteobacteria bacterium]
MTSSSLSVLPKRINPRAIAIDLLHKILDHAISLDDAERRHPSLAKLEKRDRAFIHLNVLTVLRRLGQIDDIIDQCLTTGRRPDRKIRHLLRLAIAEILFLDVAPYATVDEAVNLTKTLKASPLAGFVNALLRRVVRDGAQMMAMQDSGRMNVPSWLRHRWEKVYGEDLAAQIAAAHLSEPPLDISVKGDPDRWAKLLEGEVLPTQTVRVKAKSQIPQLPGYETGAWWVQDAAAALPANLLLKALPENGQGALIIDLCAAPGGKTAQLAMAGAKVIAVDRSPMRLDRLRQNLDRLSLAHTVEIRQEDVRTLTVDVHADGVLLDAPCTATGTLRRHPEIAYLRTSEDIGRAAALQSEMITRATHLLRPGGVLVYAVCSLEPEEGPNHFSPNRSPSDLIFDPIGVNEVEGIAEFLVPPFLGQGASFALQTLPCYWPEKGGLDGFWAARLRRA